MEVYEHLHRHFGIKTKKDMAEAIGQTLPAMYAAFGGKEGYLTDNLFRRISWAWKDVFNLDYLLTGEGDLLTGKETATVSSIEQQIAEPAPSYMPPWVSTFIDILSTQVKENEALNRQLRHSITQMEAEIIGLRTQLTALEKKLKNGEK